MTTVELEQLLLTLSPAEKRRLIELLTQSLPTETTSTPQQADLSLVEFFRNSPLCEVADELDLTRDKSPILDRVNLDLLARHLHPLRTDCKTAQSICHKLA